MLQQIPDKETQNNSKTPSNKARRRRKRKFSANQKNVRKDIKIKNSKFYTSMSTWAENFTVAATWQLKHQIAYWKARAKALEYENRILHDIIRQNHFVEKTTTERPDDHTESQSESEEPTDCLDQEVEMREDDQEDNDFEVSEEFIQFLAENAKYKEDAKRERDLLRAKAEKEEEDLTLEQEPQETTEERQAKLQQLYGNHWQRISALEIAMHSQFIHDVDKDKPMYWPNIPFNF